MAKKKNELQLILISYCTSLYVDYLKQAFVELFPVPKNKKTSRQQLFLDRMGFLSKEFKTRVEDISQLSDDEAKAYLKLVIESLEKQRKVIPKGEATAEEKKEKEKKGEEYNIRFE